MPEITKYSIQSSTLQDIADAIREKKESEDPIAVSDFADEILSIPVTPPEPPAVIKDLMLSYKPLSNNDNVLSSDVEDGQPYYVFNDNNSSCRLSNRSDRYFGYKFSSPVVCNRMVVRLPSGEGIWAYNRSPQEWYMQGSNDDGSTWTTFAHCTESWSDYETVLTKEKEFENSTAYKWIRMYITSVPAGDPNINYIEFQNKSSGGEEPIIPQGTFEDPFDAMVDCPMCNIWYVYSYYYIMDQKIKIKLRWKNNATTGYEGFCLSMNKLGLVEGKQYKMSFVFDAGNVSALNSYPYGIKISSTRVPSSGSATGQSYVLTPDKYFVRKTGTQDFEYTFTASATNYLIVLLADLPGNTQNWMSISDFKLEEVTT